MMTPTTVTVLVDSRERYPLLFPKTVKWHADRSASPVLIQVHMEVRQLHAGDYALAGYDDEVLFERKGSMSELLQNLFTSDHRRCTTAFLKLVEGCEVPYLLLDFPLSDMFKRSPYVADPQRILDALLDVSRDFGLRLLWAGNCKQAGRRRELGELVLRVMLSHALNRDLGPIDVDAIVEDILGDAPQVVEETDE